MDVKPQRPRTRIFADENAAASAFPHKTLHSRHKSQPVLKSSYTSAAPQRFGTRKAFNDVSNLALNKIFRGNDEEKSSKGEIEKIVLKDVELKFPVPSRDVVKPKPLPIIRPATSSMALKPTTSTRQSFSSTAKNLRKIKTTIFQEREAEINPVDGKSEAAPVSELSEQKLDNIKEQAIPSEDVCETVSEGVPIEQEPLESILELPINLPLAIPSELDSLAGDLSIVEERVPRSPSLEGEELDAYKSALEMISEPALVDDLPSLAASAVGTIQELEYKPAGEELVEIRAPNSATLPEPEEYWDVEEDEAYIDDGYVTARSFKSIGETHLTSGNVTRTLYPHMDQAVRREIAAAKDLIESTLDPADVEDEAWDTSMVQEYGDEIFEYMRELEVRMSPNPHYMDKQTEIQWSMRSVLMDWIVQVHHRFGLLPETLFLCINLIDRFLSQKVVSLTKLQLVGATAIFVAAKYEEVDCPSVQEINFMVDNGYGVEEILKAERFMLSMLGFELGFPGPMSFLRRISKADDYDLETRTLAKYFLEVTIMDERFLTCVPSFTAAGAHCLARLMLRKGNWSPAHVYYSNYTYTQLLPLIVLMLECCEDPVHHHNAIYEKYLDRRYKQAAKYVQTELNAGFRVPDQNVNVSSHMYAPAPHHHRHPIDPHPYPTYWPQPA